MTTDDNNTAALAVRKAPTPFGGYNPPPDESEFRSMIFMAKQLAEAQGFVPAHFYRQPAKILAAMLYGRDLGITPTNALQHIIVIEGKATADAQLMGMLVRRAGHRLEDKTSDQSSTVTLTRGDDGSVHTFTFTMQDAQRAGLVRAGSAWQKYPSAMLYARALSGCARKAAQDALMGTAYIPEELEGSSEPTGEISILEAAPASVAALQAAQNGLEASEVTAPSLGATAAIQPTPSAPPVSQPASNSKRANARSVGPQPKRTNVVTAPQAATEPVAAPQSQPAPDAPTQPAESVPEPTGLADEPAQVDEGRQQYLQTLRDDLRFQAARLFRLQVLYKNHIVNPTRQDLWEPEPPAVPNQRSDEALQNLIQRDLAGKTLEVLDEAELNSRLEIVMPFIERRTKELAAKGIKE